MKILLIVALMNGSAMAPAPPSAQVAKLSTDCARQAPAAGQQACRGADSGKVIRR